MEIILRYLGPHQRSLFASCVASALMLTSLTPSHSWATDLDIFAGHSAPRGEAPDVFIALDTSPSLACGFDQNIENNQPQCLYNYRQGMDTTDTPLVFPDSYVPRENYKLAGIQRALVGGEGIVGALQETQSFSNEASVGLAVFNGGGAALVQPLRPLAQAVTGDFTDQRDLVRSEISNLTLGGSTSKPLLGTLLELGQYFSSSTVLFGRERVLSDVVPRPGVLEQPVWGSGQTFNTTRHGGAGRVSHVDTMVPGVIHYVGTTSENTRSCEASIKENPVLGKNNQDCALENVQGSPLNYRGNVKRSRVCLAPGSNEPRSLTHVVLITDGMPRDENLSRTLVGGTMVDWVTRFVSGNGDAKGNLAARFSQEDVPATARFSDLGCVATAASGNHNGTVPAAARSEWDQYQSCVYNVALRFRELGVQLHVAGFGVEELGANGEDNSLLRRIAELSGGTFIYTQDPQALADFVKSVGAGLTNANDVVTLSPSVSVNPGSILSNSSDVFLPLFKANSRQFAYGNLRKYRIETKATALTAAEAAACSAADPAAPCDVRYETVMVGDNGQEATEVCNGRNGDPSDDYLCFKPGSRDLWANQINGAVVTRGGSAANQGQYGPTPDGGRNILIERTGASTPYALDPLNLISLQGPLPAASRPASYGSPDGAALLLQNANQATRDYYAQTLINPLGDVLTSFYPNYAAVTASSNDALLTNERSHNLLRWLAGFDTPRFSGVAGLLTERDQLAARNAQPLVTGSSVIQQDKERSRQYYGSIIHSAPTVVTYGFDDSGDTYTYDNVVFVSGNDGFLRALDADDGAEYFSFFPQALLPRLGSWYDMPAGTLQYGLDSTWTAWAQDLPDAEGNFDGQITGSGFVRLYGGMRRGGYGYYFLDVTDRESPELLRVIDRSTTGFENMGQTWSQPVLAKVLPPGASAPLAVLFFGGGYDPDDDAENPGLATGPCADIVDAEGRLTQTRTCGNQLYMVSAGGFAGNTRADKATAGDLLWYASDEGVARDFSATTASGSTPAHAVVSNMNHSIPATVKTVDIDGDGYVDRVYVGDMGGQLFRIVINNGLAAADAASFIRVETLAQVGHEGAASETLSNDRKFYETPSAALMKYADGSRYVGIALGSGWRENPRNTDVDDEFYFFKDTVNDSQTLSTLVRPNASSRDFVLNLENYTGAFATLDVAQGLAMSANADGAYEGEKAFGTPVILFGNVFFPSYLPPTTQEVTQAANECGPPPNRSRLTFFRVGADAQAFRYNNEGLIREAVSSSDPVAIGRTSAALGGAMSNPSVYVDSESASLINGLSPSAIPLSSESVRRLRWNKQGSGQSVVPAGAVGKP